MINLRIPGCHGTYKVLSDNTVELSWFCRDRSGWARMLALVKTIPRRVFDSETKKWYAPASEELLEALAQGGWRKAGNKDETKESPVAKFGRLPVPKKYAEYATKPEEVPEVDPYERQKELIANYTLDPTRDIINGLRPYQVDFLKFAAIRNGKVALGDDMGTGKTLQSLAWLVYNRSFPALIVVNAPTKLQWEKEYKRWIGSVPGVTPRVQILYGTKTRMLDRSCSYIVNWDILTHWVRELSAVGFECIIGDEAQAIGNPDSKRAVAFRQLAAVIPECIVMSGTPARSKPAQFWTMVSCVEPQMFPSYRAFLWRYTNVKDTPWGVQFDGARNVRELHAKLVDVMLRRTKSDVMKELPPKTLDVVPLEADAAQLAEYENEEGQIANLQGVEARERLANLTRTAYLVKEKALLNWVRCFLESDEKLLLFAWHRDVVDALYDALKEFRPAKIYGGVSLKQREDEKERFISDESCRVMVCNIQSGGTGVDGFQKVCCNVAFAEFAATSTDMEQAEDRLHRGGQERPVNVYYLIAQGTIDEDMAEALDEKKRVLASVLDGKEAKDLDLIATIAARRGLRI